MNRRIGIIAEDQSDVDVLAEIIRKISPESRRGIATFLGRGCGKVRSKCRSWSEQLRRRGCDILILIHDLDEADIEILRRELDAALSPCAIKNHIIIIPIREIEAWLLSDTNAVKIGMNLRVRIPSIRNPEAEPDPKRMLARLIYRYSRKTKRYLNTIHNRHIAKNLDILAVRRCKSFVPLEAFLRDRVVADHY